MGGMMNDPGLRQQMFNNMMQDPQFMRQWVNNTQFQQNWMYPYMMQNWRMGPGMGPGMMGGPMMSYGTDTSTSPAVKTDQVTIPLDAWNPRIANPYQPLRVGVQPGTEMTWTNMDGVVHTVADVNKSSTRT